MYVHTPTYIRFTHIMYMRGNVEQDVREGIEVETIPLSSHSPLVHTYNCHGYM